MKNSSTPLSLPFKTVTSEPAHADSTSTLRPRKKSKGGWVILILLSGFFIWSAIAPLSKGAVAPGTVVVDSKRKTVQHLEGGVIKAIHVREGSQVKENEVLLELDNTKARSDRNIVRTRLFSKLAMLDRLKAQARETSKINFSARLASARDDPMVADLMRSEQNILDILRLEYENKRSIAQQRIGQLQHKLGGLQSYHTTIQRQVALLEQEIKRLEGLLKKQLVESSAVSDRFQQISQQHGVLGRTVADIGETESAINEAKLGLIQIKREWEQTLAKELALTQESVLELGSQLTAAESVLARTVIKAPITGKVLSLKVTTVGGVIGAGGQVTDIVPGDDELVIDAHLRPLDIDSVQKGMTAHVKFPAFPSRTTPDLVGTVDNVSGDTLSPQAEGGEPYYLIRVKISGAEIKKLGHLEIVPGMPAEVYIDGGSQTLLQYFSAPITSLIQKSLREE